MKAMILAAGHGKRMGPLTERCPKPLLQVRNKPLIQYHIEALQKAGIVDLVINHGRLGHLIEERFGDGNDLGVQITYSAEGVMPYETAGGIKRALPLFDNQAFIVVNADIWTDYDFKTLNENPEKRAHLVLVANPVHNPGGDFCLENGEVLDSDGQRLTYSGIGVYQPELFQSCPDGPYPLAPLLINAMHAGVVSGEFYPGLWVDVGSPERLKELNDTTQSITYAHEPSKSGKRK